MSEEHRGEAAILVTVAVWGTTFALSKPVLGHLAPTQLAFFRQLFALPPILWLGWHTRHVWLRPRHLLALAATGMVGFFLFANLGLERTSASLGGLIQGLAPALIAALAIAFLRERPGRRVVAGILLALVGAAVLAWGTLRVESGLGLVFLFLSVISFSAYAVIGRGLGEHLTVAQATVLPVCLSVVVFSFGPLFENWQPAGAGTIAAAAALGFFGSGVSYVTWSFGIARIPAARAGVYSNLVPVVAVLVAWLALGESLGPRQLAGGAVVIAGSVLASSGETTGLVGRLRRRAQSTGLA